ncbi:hypothetical protein [Heyndrickxia faecalis]|uniref:hypothetical protein n=1 Tax=Heyndrickxia faecalis TaxID=2824910 RepID=UPI0032B18305
MDFKFDVKVKKNLTRQVQSKIVNGVKKDVRTIAQDLARTSSESAPHLTGNLEKSFTITYKSSGGVYKAEIKFSAVENGFDYAIAMHEWTYNLGEGSKRKPGGTGMSGKRYPVGRKFLTGVLQGEANAYADYIKQQIRENLRT